MRRISKSFASLFALGVAAALVLTARPAFAQSMDAARAAANDDVECEEGNERPVGVAIRCGRSSITGRGRAIDHLIELEVR